MSSSLKIAQVGSACVACGCCVPVCSKEALRIESGVTACIDDEKCVGCGKCAKTCPAGVITVVERNSVASPSGKGAARATRNGVKKSWNDYLWIAELLYLTLSLCNILFAWLGMLFFALPLFVAIIGGSKAYCNRYCGRGQLFGLLGGKFKLSRNVKPPKFLRSPIFRYGFLAFFMTMFSLMLFSTYKVFTGAPLRQTVTLLWMFKLPWQWAEVGMVAPWIAQFAFGFFGVMLTSTVLGLATMALFSPRSWCVYCPMGTMTQGICKLKHRKE